MKHENFSICEKFILEKMSETRIPGLSIAIVKEDELAYVRGFGFKDLSSGVSVTPRTLFGIGSVTKSFTALAILKLVEEGKVNLEDSIEKYVPLRIRPFGEEIKIHNLLTHTSGIPALAYAEAFIRGVLGLDGHWLPVATPDDIITFMKEADKWVHCKPGEKFFYLNEGYVLLGYIISKVSGIKYEEYVKEKILKPLKMNRTYFSKVEVEADGDFATPYIVDKNGKHVPSRFPYGITSDGGLISNVIDLSNYIKMYIGRGEFEGKRIISKDLLEVMETEHIRLPYELFGGESYGYGWGIIPNFYGYKLINHSGSVLVHTAYVGYVPEKKIGVAILANSSGYPLSNIGMYVIAYLLGVNPEELPIIKKDRILSKLQGMYETYKGTMNIDVKRKGNFLIAVIRDKFTEITIPLIPVEVKEEKSTFYTISNWRRHTIEFTIKEDKVEMIYERYKLVKKI
ncbi:MAG: serine hydrolase [archaeon GB-1867-005]|nr:serine hydrolase [Candidatus Culexmicrobium cathedralense]